MTEIAYPVSASDFLDKSHWNGNGSVAGIVDNSNRIILGYGAKLTYDEAKELAAIMNKLQDRLSGKRKILGLLKRLFY